MTAANVRLKLHFDLELVVPEPLASLERELLCKALAQALGPTVIQGLPVISGKQLGKSGIVLKAHHHHLDAVNLAPAAIDPRRIVAVAPHLTDAEAAALARKVAARLPHEDGEAALYLRRQALALINEYRLVPCVVSVLLASGKPTQIQGRLNLTNGHIFPGDEHRGVRLQAAQESLSVAVTGTSVMLEAACSGHTLTGPVLDVPVPALVPHREALLERWLQG